MAELTARDVLVVLRRTNFPDALGLNALARHYQCMARPDIVTIEEMLAHSGWLRCLARGLVAGEDAAEDVVQETWLTAIERPPRHRRNLRGWLSSVARNVARQFHRGERRRRRRELGTDTRRPARSVPEALASVEMRRMIASAVLALEEPYRTTITLRYFEEMTPKEIARHLDVPRSTVSTRIRRGLERLRDRLDEDHGGDRRRWCALLAPLLKRGGPIGAAAGLTGSAALVAGGAIMTAKVKVAIAAAVVIAVGAATWFGAVSSPVEEPVVDRERREARVAPADPEPAPGEAPAVPRGPWVVQGTVYRNGRAGPARVALIALEGLDVRLADPPAPFAGTDAGPDGRFSFGGLAQGAYLVRATVASGARAAVRVGAGGQPRTEVEIDVPDGRLRLAGRATHTDGTPFVGRVGAIPVGEDGARRSRLPEVDTDPRGRFVIAHLSAGPVRLTARVSGSLWIVGPAWRVPTEGAVKFVVDAGAPIVRGRVVADDDGAPVSGARLTYHDSQDRFLLGLREHMFHLVVTDADGRFSVHAGDKGAKVWKKGFRGEKVVSPPDGGQVVVRLRRRAPRPPLESFQGKVRGQVVSAETGLPAADALVVLGESVRTDAGGRYSIDRFAGRPHVYVFGGGWVSPEISTHQGMPLEFLRVEVPRGETVGKDLRAVRTARVRGVLVGAPDDLLPDLTAEAVWSEGWRLTNPPWREIRKACRRVVPVEGAAFAIEDLIPGLTYAIRLLSPTGESLVEKKLTVPAGEESEVKLDCSSLALRVVRVVFDDSGGPVAGARVLWGNRPLRTDRDGRVTVGPTGPGKKWPVIFHPDIETFEGSVVLDESGALAMIRVTRGHRIGGVVLTPEGGPAHGAALIVSGMHGDRYFDEEVFATADGSFLATGLPAAEEVQVKVHWSRDGRWFLARADVPVDRSDLRLVVKPVEPVEPDMVEVTVLGPDGVAPARGTVLRWSQWGERSGVDHREAWIGRGGIAKYHPLPPRKGYRVWFEVFGAVAADGGSCAPLLVGPVDGESRSVQVTLTRAVLLSGAVLDERGKPVAGAVITAVPVWPELPKTARAPAQGGGPSRGAPHGETPTRADGTFTLDGLAAIDYDLASEVPTSNARPDPVRVRGGRKDVRIAAPRAAVITVRVLDLQGKPIAGALVSAYREHRRIDGRRTDGAGVAKPVGLDPAESYSLRIRAPDHVDEVIDDWCPADGVHHLPLDRPISGVVHDSRGPVRRWVRVHYRVPGRDEWRQVTTGNDGTFRLTEIPEGMVEIRAMRSTGGRSLDDAESVTVNAGAKDVVVPIR
jgi:RNA polymerase sigma factor (sigma-70 family)